VGRVPFGKAAPTVRTNLSPVRTNLSGFELPVGFPGNYSDDPGFFFEIEAFFTFTATERQVIEQRLQPALKLGFKVHPIYRMV